MLFQIILFVALSVGTVFYLGNLGGKKVAIYWAIFIGAVFLVAIAPVYLVILIQLVTVGVFYAHAKSMQMI